MAHSTQRKRSMAEPEPPPTLRDLDARLKRARAADSAKEQAESEARERGKGLSQALKIGVELVASLVVGVGIGLLLDNWLGTAPWLLVVFFVLGAAAGMLNVYRVMSGMGQGVGYAAQRRQGEEGDDRGER